MARHPRRTTSSTHTAFAIRPGTWRPPIDEKDGAGIPVASVLKKIIDNAWYDKGALYPSSFDSASEYHGPTVTLQPGQGVRVVLGYTHCSEVFNTDMDGEFLAVDLDLQLRVNGHNIGWSWSSNNSLEFWEYGNSSGSPQNVEIIVKRFGSWQNCNGEAREYYGIAWAKHTNYIVN